MFDLLETMEPCKIGMEACSGAQDTARGLRAMGHDARIMAPKYVLKFRQKQKNDANDAEAICKALLHRTTRFVPIKSIAQQAVGWHSQRFQSWLANFLLIYMRSYALSTKIF
jgi:transposase